MKLAHLLPSSMRSLLTPMASAIWRRNQPRCRRSQAWRRRASFPLRANRFMHGSLSPRLSYVRSLCTGQENEGSAMRCFWLVTAVLAITFGTAGQVHADFVVNGSFEAVQIGSPFYSGNPDDIPGWTHTGAPGDALLWAVGYPHVTVAGDGRQFVTLGGGIFVSGTASWEQTLTGLSPGGTYTLTFEMASEQAVSGFQSITVDFPSGSPTGAMTFTAGTTSVDDWQDWEQKTLDFVASSSAVTLRFSATTQYDVGLDNVRVEAKTVPELAALTPAKVWIGLKNSDDVGLRLDLFAEVFLHEAKVGEGQLNNVASGSSGFNNAKSNTIPLTLFASVEVPLDAELAITLSVRRTCFGGGHNSGTPRLWYNDRQADSRFGATIEDTTSDFFLGDGFVLATTPGTGPKKTIDVPVDNTTPCPNRPFTPFGTWGLTLP
jgi:hypothetical protein